MTDVHEALYAFWSAFGIPAYLAGHVPVGAIFPYITFEVADGAAFSSGILTAFVWCKAAAGANANAQRAGYLDAIAAAIPQQGTVLTLSSGVLCINRNTADFESYYDDPTDPTVFGGRVSCEVRYLHA